MPPTNILFFLTIAAAFLAMITGFSAVSACPAPSDVIIPCNPPQSCFYSPNGLDLCPPCCRCVPHIIGQAGPGTCMMYG